MLNSETHCAKSLVKHLKMVNVVPDVDVFASPGVKGPNLKQKSGDLLECFTALHFQLFIIFFCVCIFSLCTLLIRIKKGTMKTSTNCPLTTSEDLRYICMVSARRPPTFQTQQLETSPNQSPADPEMPLSWQHVFFYLFLILL